MIDFVIVRARDQGDVQITKSITSADDCWTDHCLVRSSFALKLHHKKWHIAKQPKKRIDVERLKDPALLEELQLALGQSLASVHGNNVEEFWQALKAVILSSGYSTRKHQDWFDENDYVIEELIDGKTKAFCTWQNDPTNETKRSAYHNIRAEVQRCICHMKDEWWTAKAEQLQGLADKGDTRGFFSATRTIFGPSTRGETPIKHKDGTLLKDTVSINQHWKDHFQELLNHDSTVDESVFDKIPQLPVNAEFGAEPTLSKTKSSIKQMKNNKVPGFDGIPAEIFKYGGDDLALHLHQLILLIWRTEEITLDLQDVDIVKIFKKRR